MKEIEATILNKDKDNHIKVFNKGYTWDGTFTIVSKVLSNKVVACIIPYN